MTSINELDELNARYALSDQLRFHVNRDGVVLADIRNQYATARIALQGAQVLTYQPNDAAPVLWLSEEALCRPGKTIRGGIPVCWPWFGPHPTDPGKPAHGYARTAPWEVRRSSATVDATELQLGLPMRPEYQAFTPYATLEVSLAVSVSAKLSISLTTRNTGTVSIPLSQALHTYFNISDISAVRIIGLEGCEYIDKVDNGVRKLQQGPVSIHGEVDRIYLQTGSNSVIEDSGLRRRIHIKHEGSHSTVVWNPWIEKAEKLGDLGPDGYRRMVCVENTNAADDTRQLEPGTEHTLMSVIGVEATP